MSSRPYDSRGGGGRKRRVTFGVTKLPGRQKLTPHFLGRGRGTRFVPTGGRLHLYSIFSMPIRDSASSLLDVALDLRFVLYTQIRDSPSFLPRWPHLLFSISLRDSSSFSPEPPPTSCFLAFHAIPLLSCRRWLHLSLCILQRDSGSSLSEVAPPFVFYHVTGFRFFPATGDSTLYFLSRYGIPLASCWR